MTDLYKKYAPPFKERIYIPEWFYNDNRFPSSFDVIRKKYEDKRYKYVELLIQSIQRETDKAIQLDAYTIRVCSDEKIKELEKMKKPFPDRYKDMIRDECFIEITNSEQWIPKSLIRKKD